MAYEQRDGDISVFTNDKKGNDKAPDWKGTALIDGQKYEVAFWTKGNRGTMLAGSIKIARSRDDRPTGGGGSTGGSFADDQDIPFITQWSDR